MCSSETGEANLDDPYDYASCIQAARTAGIDVRLAQLAAAWLAHGAWDEERDRLNVLMCDAAEEAWLDPVRDVLEPIYAHYVEPQAN